MARKIRVGINGLGVTGRQAVRAWWKNHQHDVDLVAVNGRSGGPERHARLLRHDSDYGEFPTGVVSTDECIYVGGQEIRVFQEEDPAVIDWNSMAVDVVIDSTGEHETRHLAEKHLGGSVKKVVISSAGKGEGLDLMTIMGINHELYDPSRHHVIANGSCTTNCVVPMAKVMHDAFGIHHGIMTTVHAYTGDQNIVDGSHRDPRRARGAAQSIIPTSTGAAEAVGIVIPELNGKLTGMALRVPTPVVSIVDLTLEVDRPVTKEEVNAAFRAAAQGSLSGILAYEREALVSVDFKGNSASAIIDPLLTIVNDGTQVKVFGWYDNEYGYSCRLMDLMAYIAERGLE